MIEIKAGTPALALVTSGMVADDRRQNRLCREAAARQPDFLIAALRGRFDAMIVDLDGVVVRTAATHAAAWKDMFDVCLRRWAAASGEPFRPFDAGDDYRRHVDGKPRLDGVRDFLAARGVRLAEGSPDDPPGCGTVNALAAWKNAIFQARLARDGVEVFAGTVALIRRLRAAGLRTGLVSSSRNALPVLAAAGLTDLFDLSLDGVEAARLGLRGKPEPDMFRCAANRLGVQPARAVAAEDATAGVRSAHAAGYGLVIGVDRDGGGAAALAAAGADLVVADLAALDAALCGMAERGDVS